MADPPQDDRSPIATAASWSANIMTVCMEMVIPVALGYWVDDWLGTRVVFVILGAIGGMALGTMHLVRLVSATSDKRGTSSKRSGPVDRQPGDKRES